MKKLVKFVAAGIPAFAVAMPLNYALVTWGQLPKPLSYAIVLFLQVSVNYFLLRAFVFDLAPNLSLGRSYLAFLGGIALFRGADWAVYVLLTSVFGVYFLAAQLINGALFVVLKFQFSKLVFEKSGAAGLDAKPAPPLPHKSGPAEPGCPPAENSSRLHRP